MRILAAFDGSEPSMKAVRKALDLASTSGAEIVLLSVVPDLCLTELGEDLCRQMYDDMTREAEEQLRGLVEEARALGLSAQSRVLFGHPVEKILEEAERGRIDVIVMGSRGRHGLTKALLGSVSSKVAETAPCDVLIVRRKEKE